MNKNVLIIGGTRFFGRELVRRVVNSGHSVTILTRGLQADDFGEAVRRIRVDRRDRKALARSLEGATFDIVYDQMCYNPVDARAICEILDGRVGHYIMSSTIEVYGHLSGIVANGYAESDIDLSRLSVSLGPWPAETSGTAYGAGKRQAEAVIARSSLKWSTVRIAHVLSGPDDFTGRLADYVGRARSHGTLYHSPSPGPSSFITSDRIAEFLHWIGEHGHTGVFNAAADETLTAIDLQHVVSSTIGNAVATLPAAEGAVLSPFDFPAPHAMSTKRAREHGFHFGTIRDRIPDLVRAHVAGVAS
jgi:nucleoside-diphosphate-sugar epimerase